MWGDLFPEGHAVQKTHWWPLMDSTAMALLLGLAQKSEQSRCRTIHSMVWLGSGTTKATLLSRPGEPPGEALAPWLLLSPEHWLPPPALPSRHVPPWQG